MIQWCLRVLSDRGLGWGCSRSASVRSYAAALLALASWIKHTVDLVLDRADYLRAHIDVTITDHICILHHLSRGIDLLLRLQVLRAFISYPLLVQFNEVARCLVQIIV